MPDFEIIRSGWYSDETDELEFDDDSDLELAAEDRVHHLDELESYYRHLREYIDTNDEVYYPAEIGI